MYVLERPGCQELDCAGAALRTDALTAMSPVQEPPAANLAASATPVPPLLPACTRRHEPLLASPTHTKHGFMLSM